MRNIIDETFIRTGTRKNALSSVLESQHPVMYWWFASTSLCFCSVYIILLTKF